MSVAAGAVTLVEGLSFCISSAGGDFYPAEPHGVFFRDTRILSRWDLRVDGQRPQPLTTMTPEPYRATFVARLARPSGRTDSHLLVQRERRVGNGLREDLVISNFGDEPAACSLSLSLAADFADLFEVKEGRVQDRGRRQASVERERLVLGQHWRGGHRGAVVEAPGASQLVAADPTSCAGWIGYEVVVPARQSWSATLLVRPVVDGEEVEPSFPLSRPVEHGEPAVLLQRWQDSTPMARTGHDGLTRVLRRSQQDLGALRIFDPVDARLPAVAAGAPWFMALFGRDSLLTSYMALPLDRGLALGTLRTLARQQGRQHNPLTEEQPGRILHEVRLGSDVGLALGGGSTYYGTADATPLFVVLLGELARWGGAEQDIRELLPAADRALEWIEGSGDRDGDRFVEYQRATDRGLRNQGWKDSWDGVTFADGHPAEPPIALCEVQGYVYDAYRARAFLAAQLGEQAAAGRWLERAQLLKEAFNAHFWLPERGWYALGLDRDKKAIDACASNMGHCLWSGIVDADKASQVADQLMSPAMFSGWGIRTLSTAMGAYDPMSYHNGSVWPHDNALTAAGLMRYGFVEHAQRVAGAILDAAEAFGGRLPELFCGFDRADYPEPVPYPTSCSPQAWAAASPIQLVRTLLRFQPLMPYSKLWASPVLPDAYQPLRVDGVALGDDRVSIEVTARGTSFEGLPDSVRILTEGYPRDDLLPPPPDGPRHRS